jgi:hypothetical protein
VKCSGQKLPEAVDFDEDGAGFSFGFGFRHLPTELDDSGRYCYETLTSMVHEGPESEQLQVRES